MSRKPRAKNHISSYGRDISFVVLLFVMIAAFANILSLSLQYSSGTEAQATKLAETYSEDFANSYIKRMNELRDKANSIAIAANAYTNDLVGRNKDFDEIKNELNIFFHNTINSTGYKEEGIQEIKYFASPNGVNDGETDTFVEYNSIDAKQTEEENHNVLKMRKDGVLATYGLIDYDAGTDSSIACYCPVPKTENGQKVLDAIVVFYAKTAFLNFTSSLDENKTVLADFQAVCNRKSTDYLQIIKPIRDKDNVIKEYDSFENYLKLKSNDGVDLGKLKGILYPENDNASEGTENVNKHGITTISVTLKNDLYVLAVGEANATDTGLCVVALYNVKDIYGTEYNLVISIVTTMAILGLIIIIFFLYYVVSRIKMRRRINQMNMVNATLDCPTLLKYEKDVKEILTRNKATQFAVIISHVHHFNYITETFGDAVTTDMLKHMKEAFSNALMVEETYGYIENGEFVLLLHYKDKDRLENRLVGLYAAIKRTSQKDLKGYDLKLCYGIYEAGKGSDEPVQRMVEKAMVVKNLPSRSDVNQICHFYNENVRSDYLHRAEIEGRMEAALASGEFRVFYQPKYNLEKDYIDGAELLVRWYDPAIKKYRRPNEFLPVFEENGFISKLDRHIYYTACETLADRISKGKRIFPISVNVSRVTAIQPDFIAYYIKVKNHFKIANGFITLEFTESFAYENYEYLSATARELRKAGFLCSIDDFGTGYSSYNVLKTLNMDELKMDKFFLDEGESAERDQIIIENVIDISKKLNLKATQEGVETVEQLKMLKKLGCTVIQGYFFAKPMSLSDYDKFIDDFFVSNKIVEALKK